MVAILLLIAGGAAVGVYKQTKKPRLALAAFAVFVGAMLAGWCIAR